MTSKKIILSIKKLCNSLEYKTSGIVCYKNRNATFGTNIMYKISINAEGIRELGSDLLELENKFGKQISLWKKRDAFFKRWEKCTGERATKNFEGKNIHYRILELFKQNKNLAPPQVSRKLKLDYNRIYNLMKNMYKRNEIIRIRKGVYSLI